MGHISRSALAREIGRSLYDVDRLLAEGLPHRVVGNGRGSKIQIDRNAAMKWLARHALDGKSKSRGRSAPLPQPAPEPEWPLAIQAIMDQTSTDLERGYALALMLAVYETPRVVGGMAIQAEAALSMNQAYEVSRAATVGMMHVLFEDAAEAGMEPFASAAEDGPEIICPDAFRRLDWRQVAENAGEPGWRPPRSIPGWVDDEDEDDDGEAEGAAEGDAVGA